MLLNQRFFLNAALTLGFFLISADVQAGLGCSKLHEETPLLRERGSHPIIIPENVLTPEELCRWAKEHVRSASFKQSELYGILKQEGDKGLEKYAITHRTDPHLHLYCLSKSSRLIWDTYKEMEDNYRKRWDELDSLYFIDVWTLPLGIIHATGLRSLSLSGVTLHNFPEGFPPLQRLTSLNLKAVFPKNPDFLQGLMSLKSLYLIDNHFNSPPNFPESLHTSLKVLRLSGNDFNDQDLSSLEQLEELTHLTLKENRLKGAPDYLVTLSNLESFDLSCNHIVDMPSLKNLTKLVGLNLSFNPLSTFPEVEITNKWYKMDLSHTEIAEIPEWIGGLKFLRLLSLDNTYVRKLPPSLGHCKRLVTLKLNYGWGGHGQKFPPLDAQIPVQIDKDYYVINLPEILNYLEEKADGTKQSIESVLKEELERE